MPSMGTEVRLGSNIENVDPKIQKKIAEIDSAVAKNKLNFDDAKILALNDSILEISLNAQAEVARVVTKQYDFASLDPSASTGVEPFEYVSRYLLLEERFGVPLKDTIREFQRTPWTTLLTPFTEGKTPSALPFHSFVVACECAVIAEKSKASSEAIQNLLKRPINAPYVHGEFPEVTNLMWPKLLEQFYQFTSAKKLSSNSDLSLGSDIMEIVTHPSFFNLHKLLKPVKYKPSKFIIFTL